MPRSAAREEATATRRAFARLGAVMSPLEAPLALREGLDLAHEFDASDQATTMPAC